VGGIQYICEVGGKFARQRRRLSRRKLCAKSVPQPAAQRGLVEPGCAE
jgi:hypothetical protein